MSVATPPERLEESSVAVDEEGPIQGGFTVRSGAMLKTVLEAAGLPDFDDPDFDDLARRGSSKMSDQV